MKHTAGIARGGVGGATAPLTRWIMVIFLLLSAGVADAARKKKNKGGGAADAAADVKVKETGGGKRKKPKVFDFGAIGIEGSMRTPQLLYFLGRAREELERAALEKRSFMPELARSVDEGSL